jgi:hypothetical protein
MISEEYDVRKCGRVGLPVQLIPYSDGDLLGRNVLEHVERDEAGDKEIAVSQIWKEDKVRPVKGASPVGSQFSRLDEAPLA